jgi:hypothetical protein
MSDFCLFVQSRYSDFAALSKSLRMYLPHAHPELPYVPSRVYRERFSGGILEASLFLRLCLFAKAPHAVKHRNVARRSVPCFAFGSIPSIVLLGCRCRCFSFSLLPLTPRRPPSTLCRCSTPPPVSKNRSKSWLHLVVPHR